MIPCAIAGLGRWGRSLLDAAHRGGRLRITHAVEPDAARGRDVCAQHGLSWAGSLDAVLADPGIAAVLLATPHSLHLDQVVAAAKAGKHVFCEKPLALGRAHGEQMFAACQAAGVVLAVGHNRRFWPAMHALRTIVAGGELGDILHVEGHNSNEHARAVTEGWRLLPEESPGGGLTGAGLHVLDAFVSILGPASRVYARFNPYRSGLPPRDSAMRAIDFENGVTATLATVRTTPFYWRVHVFGTEGSVEVLDEAILVRRRSGATTPETVEYPAADALVSELAAFADAVEGRYPFPVPADQVLATLSAFEAALRSMATGQPEMCGNNPGD